ncbi:hypothetical protein PENPOL_c007G08307 [Penicillium polonicum]|uniref:Uncharacterized protein n=1 Tax=Penicillium polonicum TaxID=60169 RepID=A0A1V6NJV6_PENPO|nr:hypothetical protein PENPOL_c007G08307 [Penicillium polonicum]
MADTRHLRLPPGFVPSAANGDTPRWSVTGSSASALPCAPPLPRPQTSARPIALFCTQCHQYGHSEVNCHWLSRIGAAVRAATAPAPSNKRARRGTKGNKANKKAKSAAKNAAREGGKDLRKEAEAEASGGEGPAPASPRAADPPLALSPPTLGPRAPTMLAKILLPPAP